MIYNVLSTSQEMMQLINQSIGDEGYKPFWPGNLTMVMLATGQSYDLDKDYIKCNVNDNRLVYDA